MSTTTREIVIRGKDELSGVMRKATEVAQDYGRAMAEHTLKNSANIEEAIKHLERETELLQKNAELRGRGGGAGGGGGGAFLPSPASAGGGGSQQHLLSEILNELRGGSEGGSGGQGGGVSTSRGIGGVRGGVSSMASSMARDDGFGAASAGAGMLRGVGGMVGGAAAGVAAVVAAIGGAMALNVSNDPAPQSISRMLGGTGVRDVSRTMRLKGTEFEEAEAMGISNTDYAKFTSMIMGKTGAGTMEGTIDYARLRNVGIGEGTAGQLARLGMVGGGAANSIYGALANTGMLGANGQNFTQLDEIMSNMTGMALSANTRSGANIIGGDTDKALNLLGGVEGMTPDRLNREMGGLQSGIAGGSQMAQSLKLSMLRGMDGNKDKTFFELQSEMDKGLSSGLMSSSLDMVRGMTGNRNAQQQMLSQMFGGQVSKQGIIDLLDADPSKIGSMSIEDIAKRESKIDVSGSKVGIVEFGAEAKDILLRTTEGVESMVVKMGKLLNLIE